MSTALFLSSVVALEHRQLRAGEVVEMRLMKRERHSLQPQPVQRSQSASTVSPAQPPSLQESGGNHVYSKLLLATPRDVVDLILSLEKKDLLDQWEKERDCPESCFIQQALELLAMRESSAVSEPEGTDVATSHLKSEYSEVETATVVAMESVEDETLTEDTELLDVIADLDSISMSDCSRSRYTSMSSEGHFDHQVSDDVERVSGSPPVSFIDLNLLDDSDLFDAFDRYAAPITLRSSRRTCFTFIRAVKARPCTCIH